MNLAKILKSSQYWSGSERMEFAPLGGLPTCTVLLKDKWQYVRSPLDTANPQTEKFHFYGFMLTRILDKFAKENIKIHTRTLFKITKSWKQHK